MIGIDLPSNRCWSSRYIEIVEGFAVIRNHVEVFIWQRKLFWSILCGLTKSIKSQKVKWFVTFRSIQYRLSILSLIQSINGVELSRTIFDSETNKIRTHLDIIFFLFSIETASSPRLSLETGAGRILFKWSPENLTFIACQTEYMLITSQSADIQIVIKNKTRCLAIFKVKASRQISLTLYHILFSGFRESNKLHSIPSRSERVLEVIRYPACYVYTAV